jgi:hypothetical protein
MAVPERESEHAYVRRADGVTYVCPWQTRLRCLLAYGRALAAGPPVPGTVPASGDDRATAALARLEASRAATRLHILASAWTVPLAWFVPFAAAERWLSLGPDGRHPSGGAGSTAAATRALVYTTLMTRARRRVARGLAALRAEPAPGGPEDPARTAAELAGIARWLAEFHPYSLVELDYGGLVHLLDDHSLAGDQSVAEMRAAVDGAMKGERELAVAMYRRAHCRWRELAAFEQAN